MVTDSSTPKKCIECPKYNFIESICDADTSEITDLVCLLRLCYWTLTEISDEIKD
jgi:hypothetical protein